MSLLHWNTVTARHKLRLILRVFIRFFFACNCSHLISLLSTHQFLALPFFDLTIVSVHYSTNNVSPQMSVSRRLVKELISDLPLGSVNFAFAYGSGVVPQVFLSALFFLFKVWLPQSKWGIQLYYYLSKLCRMSSQFNRTLIFFANELFLLMVIEVKIKENERMEDKMVDLVLCTKDPQVRIIWNLRPRKARITIPFCSFTVYQFSFSHNHSQNGFIP